GGRALSRSDGADDRDPARLRGAGASAERVRDARRRQRAECDRHDRFGLPWRSAGPAREPRHGVSPGPARRSYRAARDRAGDVCGVGRGRGASGERARQRRLREHRWPGGAEVIDRYTRPEMGRLWSEESRLGRWLEIELAVVEVLAERGEVPAAAA